MSCQLIERLSVVQFPLFPVITYANNSHLAIKGRRNINKGKIFMFLSRKWERETRLLTCMWPGSGWLRFVLSAYSCNRLKTSRLRTASCRYLRFVSGEALLRCANCHSVYFESMKSLRTALSITLNILIHVLLLGIKMAVKFNRCPIPIKCAVKL